MTSALVLLVGNNPLPNYVSCRALWTDKGAFDRLVLVYSRPDRHGNGGTEDVMRRLSTQLSTDLAIEPGVIAPVSLKDPADAGEIQQAVGNAVADCDAVHLNYTGGTKVMSVHAFAAVSSLQSDAESSYLDPRTFKLRFGDGTTSASDLRDQVRLDFEPLFEMHGTPIYETGDAEPFLPNTAGILARAMCETDPGEPRKQIADTFGSWKWPFNDEPRLRRRLSQTAEEHAMDRYNLWRADHPNIPFPDWIQQPFNFPNLGATFAEESGLDATGGINFRELAYDPGNRIREFFGGKWLESAVLQAVNEGAGVPARMGVKFRRAGAREGEVDVIALRGYQVFLFSCTTAVDDRARNIQKQHGFEAAHRALQLGGEEARAILVTPSSPDRVRGLEQDLKTDLGGALNVRVVGRSGLRNLRDTVRKILEAV